MTNPRQTTRSGKPVARSRGSVLMVAMIFAAGISLVLVSYLQLGRTTLKVSHRTFFANDAANLAEAGLEEALYCFGLVSGGTTVATAWSGWTLSGSNAMRTLPTFNRDQNAVGVVKVHVTGYDGSSVAPIVLSQAVITPFDGGAPIVKTLQLTLGRGGANVGIVGIAGIDLKRTTRIDSFVSNPTGAATGPWVPYSSAIARARATVATPTGEFRIASGKVHGDLYLGSAVLPPAAASVTGSIYTNFTATFPLPVFPTAASVSQSYNLGATIPATLPVAGHLPAADGRYYYFCANTTITNVAITASRNVTIVGTNTGVSRGVTVPVTSTCQIYVDGPVSLARNTELNSLGWAGALKIWTTTTATCSIDAATMVCCLYAPNAALSLITTGGGSGSIAGSFVMKTIMANGDIDIHYDESLSAATTSTAWTVTRWFELQSAADRATVAATTGNYLQ